MGPVSRNIYWAAEGALVAALVLLFLVPMIPWRIAAAMMGLLQIWLMVARLRDAGRNPWAPALTLATVILGLRLLGELAATNDHLTGGDGAGLLWVMFSACVIVICIVMLVVWAGLIPPKRESRAPGDQSARSR